MQPGLRAASGGPCAGLASGSSAARLASQRMAYCCVREGRAFTWDVPNERRNGCLVPRLRVQGAEAPNDPGAPSASPSSNLLSKPRWNRPAAAVSGVAEVPPDALIEGRSLWHWMLGVPASVERHRALTRSVVRQSHDSSPCASRLQSIAARSRIELPCGFSVACWVAPCGPPNSPKHSGGSGVSGSFPRESPCGPACHSTTKASPRQMINAPVLHSNALRIYRGPNDTTATVIRRQLTVWQRHRPDPMMEAPR